jgi:hypothetical protein
MSDNNLINKPGYMGPPDIWNKKKYNDNTLYCNVQYFLSLIYCDQVFIDPTEEEVFNYSINTRDSDQILERLESCYVNIANSYSNKTELLDYIIVSRQQALDKKRDFNKYLKEYENMNK